MDVRTRHEVVSIDRKAQKVSVKDLATGDLKEHSYDKLILATGSSAIVPPVPGVDLTFVFTLKTLEDTDRIYA